MAKVNDFMLQADRDKKAATFEMRRLAWMKKRQKGKNSYIFRYGLLGFGGFCFYFPYAVIYRLIVKNSKERACLGLLWGIYSFL